MKRIAVVAILLLAFCGLADSAYLAKHVVNGAPVICNIQGLSDCNTIIASPYSHFFGIPLALLGVFFYGMLFILAALELVLFDWFLRRALQVAATIGLLASLYFTFLQEFVIRALCAYCLTSALIALIVFVFATRIEPVRKGRVLKIGTRIDEVPPPPHLPMPPTL
jgi:uncharacterized membrane protein